MSVRYYSERDYPLGPPATTTYEVGPSGEPLLPAPDRRPWLSVEWARDHGYAVPENWRDME
jgi:hypothetical protein